MAVALGRLQSVCSRSPPRAGSGKPPSTYEAWFALNRRAFQVAFLRWNVQLEQNLMKFSRPSFWNFLWNFLLIVINRVVVIGTSVLASRFGFQSLKSWVLVLVLKKQVLITSLLISGIKILKNTTKQLSW